MIRGDETVPVVDQTEDFPQPIPSFVLIGRILSGRCFMPAGRDPLQCWCDLEIGHDGPHRCTACMNGNPLVPRAG